MDDDYRDWQDEPVKVVMNHERICSIWPADRCNAPGWTDVGFSGSKEECLKFVVEHCDEDCRLRSDVGLAAQVPDPGQSATGA
jgi:uncharacterized protein YbdZ (MbtH family)